MQNFLGLREKSGILRKNITFTFYKYTELNPDRNSQSSDWTNRVGLHFSQPLNFPFKIMRLGFPESMLVSLVSCTSQQAHWFQLFARMLQDSIICSCSHLLSSHTAKATEKTSWCEEASLKSQRNLPIKLTQCIVKFQNTNLKNTETYPYLFEISQRWDILLDRGFKIHTIICWLIFTTLKKEAQHW